MAALAAFLPVLDSRVAGVWKGGQKNADGVIQMPWFEYSDELLAFIRAFYAGGWVDTTCNWVEDGDWVRGFTDEPERLDSANVEDVRRLITAHLRADRFNEGHIASVVESGHMAALVRRLVELSKAPE